MYANIQDVPIVIHNYVAGQVDPEVATCLWNHLKKTSGSWCFTPSIIPIHCESSVVPRCWERANRLTGWLPMAALSWPKATPKNAVASRWIYRRSIFDKSIYSGERKRLWVQCLYASFFQDQWFLEKSWWNSYIFNHLQEEQWHNGKGANRVKTKQAQNTPGDVYPADETWENPARWGTNTNFHWHDDRPQHASHKFSGEPTNCDQHS